MPHEAIMVGTVFVIMTNDYPHAVFSSKDKAKDYANRGNALTPTGRVYYKVYPFAIDYNPPLFGEKP